MASRLLHWSGALALATPLLNATRLRTNEAGRSQFPFFRSQRTRNAQILIYHRVNDDMDPYFGGIPPSAFERQMAYVSSRFRVLPLSALVEALGQGTVPDNAVAVTFDDGYRDNYTHAFPILKRHSIPAAIFLTTSVIGSDRQLWHDDVFSAFRETKEHALDSFGDGAFGGSLATVPERLDVQRRFLAHIRTLSVDERAAAIARLRDVLRVGTPPKTPGLMLSWDDVAAMHRAGIEFGSHTATHPILSRMQLADARREIAESKRHIEERLNVRVAGFAYPNGSLADFSPETKALLREAGYAYAVTTVPGPNEAGQDPFELHRATPWEQDVFAFGLRLHYNKLRS